MTLLPKNLKNKQKQSFFYGYFKLNFGWNCILNNQE